MRTCFYEHSAAIVPRLAQEATTFCASVRAGVYRGPGGRSASIVNPAIVAACWLKQNVAFQGGRQPRPESYLNHSFSLLAASSISQLAGASTGTKVLPVGRTGHAVHFRRLKKIKI